MSKCVYYQSPYNVPLKSQIFILTEEEIEEVKMYERDDLIQVTLKDADTQREVSLQLSPNSFIRAENDSAYAYWLLNKDGPDIGGVDASDNPILEAENKENFKWSESAILLLLEQYKLQEPLMSCGKITHKKAWINIANEMEKKGHTVTGKQCMTRFNTMKRTYKVTKDHNGKSGNSRRYWKYFDAMESLIGQKPYMAPLATISSTAPQNNCGNSSSIASAPRQVARKRNTSEPLEKLLEARQAAEEGRERRHKERIEIQKKLLEVLNTFVMKE